MKISYNVMPKLQTSDALEYWRGASQESQENKGVDGLSSLPQVAAEHSRRLTFLYLYDSGGVQRMGTMPPSDW